MSRPLLQLALDHSSLEAAQPLHLGQLIRCFGRDNAYKDCHQGEGRNDSASRIWKGVHGFTTD